MQKAFEKIKNGLWDKAYFHWDNVQVVDVADAIEIVNQVAEEYKSTEHINCTTEEVCEWVEKSVDSIRLVREPHRLRLFHIEEDREYCPYCGKRIFVKE